MKMDKSSLKSRLLIIIVSFVAGWVVAFACFSLVVLSGSSSVRKRSETKQATAFFYRTAHALFEGTYNSEDGLIKEHALNAFKKIALNQEKKCYAKIYDNESGYHGGVVFFPSGDIFHVIIMPHPEQDFVITDFGGMGWDTLWSSELRSALPRTY